MADEDVDPLTRSDEIGQKLDSLSATVDARFAQVDARFAQTDARMDARFAQVDASLAAIDEHFAEQRRYIEYVYDTLRTEMHAGFLRVDRRFDRIEGKLDRFIDTQGGINRDHEVRIGALERRRARRKG